MRSARLPLAAFIVALFGASHAAATDVPSTASSKTSSPPSNYVAGLGRSADDGALQKLSGGTDVNNRITLNGDMKNNDVDNTVTGNNAIGSGAFSGSVGLPTAIQNSGNAVLIQNATIVSVQFQQ